MTRVERTELRAVAARAGVIEIARTALAQLWAMIFLLVLLPFGLVLFAFDRKQKIHDTLSVVWARGVLFLTGVRVVAEGIEHATPGERYVVAANHQSTIDVLALLVVLQGRLALRFVAKRALFHVPILGWGMRLYGHTPVDRESVRGSLEGLRDARRHVSERWCTVFFPEGTRSATGHLLPFRLGAFRIAAQARARVLPVTIDGSGLLMPKGRYAAAPGVVRVVVHAPEGPPPAASLAALRETAATCRATIESALPEALRDPAPSTAPSD
jgi:1-acyl-sn-glycerol-3-phosphate acyltransferase